MDVAADAGNFRLRRERFHRRRYCQAECHNYAAFLRRFLARLSFGRLRGFKRRLFFFQGDDTDLSFDRCISRDRFQFVVRALNDASLTFALRRGSWRIADLTIL